MHSQFYFIFWLILSKHIETARFLGILKLNDSDSRLIDLIDDSIINYNIMDAITQVVNTRKIVTDCLYSTHLADIETTVKLAINDYRLKCISADLFVNFEKLEMVSILGTLIETIEAFTFSDKARLNNIILGGNRIKRVKSNAFFNLQELTYVSLEANQLEIIEYSAFRLLPSLKKVDFSRNNLLKLDSLALSNLPSLIILFMMQF